MGRAFHKKKSIAVSRANVKGSGISYQDPSPAPSPQPPTQNQLASRAAYAEQQAVGREVQRGVDTLTMHCTELLNKWKEFADERDTRLRNFSGWFASRYVELPVDEMAARQYSESFQIYGQALGRPLTLSQRDEVVTLLCTRAVSTNDVVIMAERAIRYAAKTSTNRDGIHIGRYVQALKRRAARVNDDSDLDEALAFVASQTEYLFEQATCS
jgi:hypothetical protein